MPFNKIMDLLQLSLLIFSLIPCRVLGDTPWGSNQARYNGYDLRRGPVFYEVYYPNDDWPSATDQHQGLDSPKPERPYPNDGRILEKTYQAASDPFFNAVREVNYEPEGRTAVDRRYIRPKRPTNTLPYGMDVLPNPGEYTSGGNNENHRVTEQLRNFVEINERNYPRTARLQNRESRSNFMESNADRAPDSLTEYAKLEDDYIRPLLSAIESSARETLEKLIRGESSDQMGNSAKPSRSPRFAGSEDPVDQAAMRVVSARRPDTPIRSTNFDPSSARSESGDWRSTNQRIADLSADRSRFQNNYDQRGSVPSVLLTPEENAFDLRAQASNRPISETRAPANERSFLPAMMESPRQHQDSQSSNPNYQPPKSYRQNLIEEAKKESPKTSEKTPIVASIEVSEVKRHKVRHHHGEKTRHKHRHHHGEAGH